MFRVVDAGRFDELWRSICDYLVNGQPTLALIVSTTPTNFHSHLSLDSRIYLFVILTSEKRDTIIGVRSVESCVSNPGTRIFVSSVRSKRGETALRPINVNTAHFDLMRPPGKHVDGQPTKRSGTVQKHSSVCWSVVSRTAALRLVGFLRGNRSPRFRGMPRLCSKVEERRTSGAPLLPLVGAGWSSSFHWSIVEQRQFECDCRGRSFLWRTPGSRRLLIRRKQIPHLGQAPSFKTKVI